MKNWLDCCVSCKIGTMPMMVRVDGRTPVRIGKVIRIQEYENGKWSTALVQRIDSDGYFQADRH